MFDSMAALSEILLLLASVQVVTSQTAFCATRSTPISTGNVVVDFDAVTVNSGQGFDLVTDTFRPPESGLYWLHVSVGYPASDPSNVTLTGIPSRLAPSVVRSVKGPWDTTSRTVIADLMAEFDVLQLFTTGPLFSNEGVQTSFSGFNLNTVMSTVAAFSFGKTTTDSYEYRAICFDVIYVDTHFGLETDCTYTIPIDGIWVFVLNTGDMPGYGNSHGRTRLTIDGVITSYVYGYWYGNGYDINGITTVANVQANASVAAIIDRSPVYSDRNAQLSLMGFLYSPVSLPAVAWSVALTVCTVGPADPLPYPNVMVNEGNGWNASSHVFTAPVGGVYYVAFTGNVWYNTIPIMLELMLNGELQASVYNVYSSDPIGESNPNGNRSRGRAIMLRLAEDDQLWIRLPQGYGTGNVTPDFVRSNFIGFRILP